MKEHICDCKDPSQCWESCGELGDDENYASIDEEANDIVNGIINRNLGDYYGD